MFLDIMSFIMYSGIGIPPTFCQPHPIKSSWKMAWKMLPQMWTLWRQDRNKCWYRASLDGGISSKSFPLLSISVWRASSTHVSWSTPYRKHTNRWMIRNKRFRSHSAMFWPDNSKNAWSNIGCFFHVAYAFFSLLWRKGMLYRIPWKHGNQAWPLHEIFRLKKPHHELPHNKTWCLRYM